jgi:hypothetical protein
MFNGLSSFYKSLAETGENKSRNPREKIKSRSPSNKLL